MDLQLSNYIKYSFLRLLYEVSYNSSPRLRQERERERERGDLFVQLDKIFENNRTGALIIK